MKARFLKLPLLSLVLVTLIARGQSTIYYVDSANGSDSNPGTSSAPWKTIQKAATSVEGGSFVNVMAGTYNERVTLTTSGTAGLPITFQAQGTVVMQGFTIYADYIRVIGFEITNSNISYVDGNGVGIQGRFNEIRNNYIHDLLFGEGIWLYGGENRDASFTSDNIVTGNRITHARISGILVEGVNNLIDGNDISHTLQNPPGAPPRVGADADGIRFFGSGHIIRRNYIHNITPEDPGNPDPHIDAFQTWGPASNILIERNQVSQVGSRDQGVIVEGWFQPVTNITIRNNTFVTYGTAYAPAVLAGSRGPVTNISIVNNTIAALHGPAEYAFWLLENLNGAVIKNNAIYDHGNSSYPYIRIDAGATGFDIGFNSISKSDGQPPAGAGYPGDLWMVDPQFVNLAAGDFHLRSSSPLINAGTLLSSVGIDFEGLPRPVGSGQDIGAFEFQ
jgi:hypothetical protein